MTESEERFLRFQEQAAERDRALDERFRETDDESRS